MSKKKLAGIIVVSIVVVTAIVAPAIGEPVIDYSRLLSSLRYYGASSIEEYERIGWRYFRDTRGRRVEVNGSSMEVYEFNNETAMEEESSRISPDGWSMRTGYGGISSMRNFNWEDTPHFYKGGRVIVIYVGDNWRTINLLVKALGEQFAGT